MHPTSQPIDYSIWSFCFAKGKLPRDFIEGAPVGSNQGLLDVPMIYSAISFTPVKSKRRVYIVDTGFASGKSMTGRAFADFGTPDIVLAKVELAPADVEAILLTHLHFDHIGNIDAFPKCDDLYPAIGIRWLEARDCVRSMGACFGQDERGFLSSMNLDDIVRFERGRWPTAGWTFIDGSHELSPGFDSFIWRLTPILSARNGWKLLSAIGPYAIAGECDRLLRECRADVAGRAITKAVRGICCNVYERI